METHPDVARQSYNNYMLSHSDVAKQKGWVSTADPQVFAHNWKPGNKYAISGFLGWQNWSATKIFDLLRLHTNLAPEIVKELTWKVKSDHNKGHWFICFPALRIPQ